MIGSKIGNYEIVRELGAGGMGQVYVAEHSILGHEVAIKILHAKYLEDEEMRARFLNEAQYVAKLKHPSIVELFDFGYLDDGTGYIIMELLGGESLRERLSREPLPLDTAAELTRQVAAALAVAHEGGVIHRDLKPDNIFLTADEDAPGGLRAIVLDFGLAKQVAVQSADPELTNSGFVVGTPAYMSPEQCKGMELDGRADIYALGAVLYRMTAGKRPFDADSPGELLGQHLYVEPTPPRTLRPEISAALERVILRCLAKKPDERFGDARELSRALSSLDDEPVAVTPPPARDLATSATVRVRKPIADAPAQPPRRVGALIAVIVLLGAAATGAWITLGGSSKSESKPTTSPPMGFDAADAERGDDAATDDDAGLADASPADASPPDASAPDALDAPRSGRELALYLARARRSGDTARALAACRAGEPNQSPTLSACAIVACIEKRPILARSFWRAIPSKSVRASTERVCKSKGIELND